MQNSSCHSSSCSDKSSRVSDLLIWAAWLAMLGGVVAILAIEKTRAGFVTATVNHPYLMGMAKIGLLGTMGELLGGRVACGRWRLTGIRLWQRAFVWVFLGILFTAIFPLFSYGVDGLLAQGLLPGFGKSVPTAIWKSVFLNIVFGFPMMVFHRFTDTLIEKGKLFSAWPVVETYKSIDWGNMFRIVGFACIWFWIPAQTMTFLLPPEFRVMSAAMLAIVLGFILGLSKRLSAKKTESRERPSCKPGL